MASLWRRVALYWEDFAILLVGIWLFASPTLLDFHPAHLGMRASVGMGAVLIVLGLCELLAFRWWEEWVSEAAGVVTAVLPWVVGFEFDSEPTLNFVLCGVAVIMLAAWRLHSPGHGAAAA